MNSTQRDTRPTPVPGLRTAFEKRSSARLDPAAVRPHLPDDGTVPLLKSGAGTLAAGLLAAVCVRLFCGGIGPHGPHTNLGWLLLIVALMCLPFGSMLFLLGAAKWLRRRR